MTTVLDLNNPFSSSEIKKISRLEFGVLDPEFLKQLSVCEVTLTELYKDGLPRIGGLNDTRMGTTDNRVLCGSCNMDVKNCPGHFGHIVLARPIYHYGYIKTVLKVLRCVCFGCSRLLADYDDPRFRHIGKIKLGVHRLRKVYELCAGKARCEGEADADMLRVGGKDGCGCPQPKYIRDGVNLIVDFSESAGAEAEETAEETKRLLHAEEALSILKKISEDDMKILGFNPQRCQPAHMILTVLPISPPAVRPYVQFGSDRSEDDLTLKLLDVVKTNNQLKRQLTNGAANHILNELAQLLQFHVTTMFDNDIPGMPVATTRSKKPIKSIRARLKGKEGRLRGNLMGKRVDFSARTVITGDPNLPIDVIGVPRSVAMTLTFCETVTPLNYEKLKKLVEVGPYVWPGAKYIIREDGTRFDLRHVNLANEQQLDYGYRVERHMQDGDFILFNRQPSLHKMSIMGHTAKILPFSTFRLNLSVTSPYNADFDGDEMNLHLAQSHETRSEIKHLMMVPRQIVSPQGNRPVMGIVQDSLLGISKLTNRDTFITKDLMMDLLMWIPYWNGELPVPAIVKPQLLWTGKQLITVLLSFDPMKGGGFCKINLSRDAAIAERNDNPFCSRNDGKVIIQSNEHLAGVICKRTAGSSSGSLIHVLWHEAGAERAKDFLSAVQKVVNNWLVTTAFTVGCSDICAKEATMIKVNETLNESKLEVQRLISSAQSGELECQPGKSLIESFESRVNKELNGARETAGRIASQSLDERNNILSMVNAGSKGSTINISQIIACVGQQNVEGKRIPFGFSYRSLPHFVKHDYGPESRGFVSNSYLSGLTPQEMFFHAMGGREGIIDTACKTSETGYIQRRLIKAMEDVMVRYDRTVRNSSGDILQFLYGEDGMSGEYIEDQVIELMKIDTRTLKATCKHENPFKFYNVDIDVKEEAQEVLDAEYRRLVDLKEKIGLEVFPDGELKQHVPINTNRLIEFAKIQFPGAPQDSPIEAVEIAKRVDDLLKNKLKIMSSVGYGDAIAEEVDENAKTILEAHLRLALNSRRLLEQESLSPAGLDWLFGAVERQFNRSLAHPGECVGALAAQSIGEPATQMTLNTFHFAGVGSKNVTLGVPRLRELINVAKHVKTPSLTVYLDEHTSVDQDAAKLVQTGLEHTTLDKVALFSEIYYDPDPTETIVPEDYQWVRDYYSLPDDDEDPPETLSPWLLRIQLSNSVMVEKELSIVEVASRIRQEFSNDELNCIHVDDNADDLVLRLRVTHIDKQLKDGGGADSEAEAEDQFLQKLMGQCLAHISLRGVPNIKKVYMREEGKISYKPSGVYERHSNWVLDTDGCNLKDVLPMKCVDATRTTSNDITEIFSVLGIEAVRRALLRELRAVISFDGSYVNYRHLAILCDTMTQKGHLTSITRHGINRIDRGPLMKCSFEETVEILMEAAMFAETDNMRGVTENVMFGQLVPLGTGDFDLIIDEEKLSDAKELLWRGSGGGGVGGWGGGDGLYYDSLTSGGGSSGQSPEHLSLFTPDSGNSGGLGDRGMVGPGGLGSGRREDFLYSPASPGVGGGFGMGGVSPGGGGFLGGAGADMLIGKFSPDEMSPRSPMSPISAMSPFVAGGGVGGGGVFSPMGGGSHVMSPMSPGGGMDGGGVGSGGMSFLSPYSDRRSPTSPSYQPYSVTSPGVGGIFSPIEGEGGARGAKGGGSVYSPASPVYGGSPFSPQSPYNPGGIVASPVVGMKSPTPSFVVTSRQGWVEPASPSYSFHSPAAFMSPQSPTEAGGLMGEGMARKRGEEAYDTYSPTSPFAESFFPEDLGIDDGFGVDSPLRKSTVEDEDRSPLEASPKS